MVVHFYAEWCPQSVEMESQFEELQKHFIKQAPKDKKGVRINQAFFVKIDVDYNRDVVESSNIKHIPTFNFYHEGQIVQNIEGGSYEELEDSTDKHIKRIEELNERRV